MSNGKKETKLVLLLIATAIIFFSLSSTVSYSILGTPFMSADKTQYTLGEPVHLTIDSVNFANSELVLVSGKEKFRYFNELSNKVTFLPQSLGEYEAQLLDKTTGNLITSTKFLVSNSLISEQPTNLSMNQNNSEKDNIQINTNSEEYAIGTIVNIKILNANGSESVQIKGINETYKFVGAVGNSISFAPPKSGTYTINLFDSSGNIIKNKQFKVISKEEINEKNTKQKNIVREFISSKNKNPKKIVFNIEDSKGNKKRYVGSELVSVNTLGITDYSNNSLEAHSKKITEFKPNEAGIDKITFENLSANNSVNFKMEDLTNKNPEIKRQTALKAFSIDLSGVQFSEAKISSVAKGSDLWKCADWNFSLQICKGTWKKIMNITPGQEYNITILDSTDPGYAETGVASINTNKSIYHLNESVKITMVVLDKRGFLVNGANVDLKIKNPLGAVYSYSIGAGTIQEEKKGIYSTIFNETSVEGNYSMEVNASGQNVNSSMISNFLVKSYYEFDILRDTPVTIDPWTTPFTSKIKLISFTNTTTFDYTEILPISFPIIDSGGSIVTNDSNFQYLHFFNVQNNTEINYTANAPLVTPDLYSLRGRINYSSGIFTEARPWYIAIDPSKKVIDSDSFEDQDWVSDQGRTWQRATTGGTLDIFNERANAGSWSVRAGNAARTDQSWALAIDATNYTNITVSYYRAETGAWEASDYFLFEWYNGTGWTTGEQIFNDWGSTFVLGNFSLGPGADNNPNLILNFTHSNPTNGNAEESWFDSFVVQGISNDAPTHSTPILNSTAGTNKTSEDLTCYNQSTADSDGDSVINVYTWYKNNNSFSVLNLPFEGGTNDTYTKDYSGNNRVVTVNGAPFWIATGGQQSSGAYSYDGINDYLSVADAPELSGGIGKNLTVTAWIYANQTGGTPGNPIPFVTKYLDASNKDWGLGIATSNIFFGTETGGNNWDSNGGLQGGTLTSGAWHHVAFTQAGRDIKLYLDGTLSASTTLTFDTPDTTGAVEIGRDGYKADYFNGTIDSVRIYNETLSSQQINLLFQNKSNVISNTTTAVADEWICQVTPNDGVINGISKNSTKLIVLKDVVPPTISSVQCYNIGTGWGACSNILYGDILDSVRADCTPGGSGPIKNVTFLFQNVDDGKIYFNQTVTDNSSGYWEYNGSDITIYDSGLFNLHTTCRENSTSENDTNWMVPYGSLVASLINPNTNTNVTQNRFFNFTAQVTCTGGECGDINATLDPLSNYLANTNNLNLYSNGGYTTQDLGSYLNTQSASCSGGTCTQSNSWISGQINFANGEPYTCEQNATLTFNVSDINPTFLKNLSISWSGCWSGEQVGTNNHCTGTDNPEFKRGSAGGFFEMLIYNGTGYENMGCINKTGTECAVGNQIPLGTDNSQPSWGDADAYNTFEFRSLNLSSNYVNNDLINIIWQTKGTGTCADSNARDDIVLVVDNANLTLNWKDPRKSGAVSTTVGATPFYTIDSNPQNSSDTSCLGNMSSGQSCNVSWQVNATSDVNITHDFFTIFTPTKYPFNVSEKNTSHINITVIENFAPIVSNLTITPTAPHFSQDLNCSFVVSDANSLDTLTANISWIKNGVQAYSEVKGVTNGVKEESMLNSGNTSTGENWSCSVTPYDSIVYGTTLNSSNVTISANFPPVINQVQCQKSGVTWGACSNVLYNDNLTALRVNCSDSDGSITNATFTLENLEDSKTFFSNTTTDNSTTYFVFNNTDFIIKDSGTFNLTTSCSDNNGTKVSQEDTWLVPWGNLTVELILPNYSINVTKSNYFNFTSRVTCVGGECGSVNATLDPYVSNYSSFETDGYGFTHESIGGGIDQWHRSTESANNGSYSWKVGDTLDANYADSSNSGLITPYFELRPNSTLSFYLYAIIEDTWDPGKLEYRVDGGSWTKVPNSDFISGGYNSVFAQWSGSPSGFTNNEAVWGGTIGGPTSFVKEEINLSAYTGENISFRFRFGSDSNTPYEGMYIDDFNLTGWEIEKGVVPMNSGTPFYTITANPMSPSNNSCLSNMTAGNYCDTTWVVNATGKNGKVYEFFTIYTPLNYTTLNEQNTSHINITIINNVVPNVTNISLMPSLPINTDNLTCNFTITDVSLLDTLSANVSWYRNGSLYSSSIFSVENGVEMTDNLSEGNTSLNDVWVCGVIPIDQNSAGTQVNSSNVTILNTRPPVINQVQCQINGSSWADCSTLKFNENFSGIRANCTSQDNIITNVTFNFTNIPDSNKFFENTTSTIQSGWYYYYQNVTINNSGEYAIYTVCSDNNSDTDTDFINWTVPWGYLDAQLIDPAVDTNVPVNDFFNFTAQVTCTGGECGSVNAYLDPGFPTGSPSTGTPDAGAVYDVAGDDEQGGSYVSTQVADTTYFAIGEQNFGSAQSYMNLTYNISSLNINPKGIKNLSVELSYCHSGANNYGSILCNGADPIEKPFSGNQDVWIYNYNTNTFDDIGNLNTTDGENEVTDNFTATGDLSRYVSNGLIIIRTEINTGGSSGDAWLAVDYAPLTINYDVLKWGLVSTIPGTIPFYTTDNNPINSTTVSCLANMNYGQACNVSWQVNSTGAVNTTHEFYVDFNLTTNDLYVSDNSTKHINLTITDASLVPPTVTLVSPTDNLISNNSAQIFECSATDNRGLLNMSLYSNFDGSFKINETKSLTGTSNSTNFSKTLNDGVYTWNCQAFDTDGNPAFGNSNRTVTIDTTKPNIALNLPASGASFSSSSVNLNFTVTDNIDTSLLCNITVDDVVKDSDFLATNGSLTNRLITGLNQSTHFWNVTCVDDAGNNNFSETRNFTVSDIPPSVTLMTANNTWFKTSTVDLDFNATDNNNVTNAYLLIDDTLNSTMVDPIDNTIETFTVQGFLEGIYSWTVNVTDISDLSFSAIKRIFYVDYTPPQINLTYPNNTQIFNTGTVEFNFTATDNLDPSLLCNITINGIVKDQEFDALNNTETNRTITNLADGINKWNVTCIDNATNFNVSETRWINISAPPVVVLDTPENNYGQSSSQITLYYNATENDEFSQCSLIINGQFNQTNSTSIVNGGSNNFTLTGLADALYNWTVNCTDISGLTGSAPEIRNFTIDGVDPIVTLYNPTPDEIILGQDVNFNYSVSDNLDLLLSCNIAIDGTDNVTGIPSINGSFTNQTITITNDGLHNWSVTCFDDANNFGVSETRNFTTRNPPIIYLNAPNADAILNYGQDVEFNYSVLDFDGVANSSLIINGALNTTNTTPIINFDYNYYYLNLSDGVYEWNVNATDIYGLEGTSTPRNLTIDTTPPKINITTPKNNDVVTWNNVSFQFIPTDNLDQILTCNVTINDVLEYVDQNISNGSTFIGSKPLTDGNYNWSVICIDHAGWTSSTGLINFTVDAPPNVTLNYPIDFFRTNLINFTFNYTPSDFLGIANCSIYLDNQVNNTDTNIDLNVPNYFNITNINEGEHNWTVLCIDEAPDLNSYAPPNETFIIDLTGPNITLLNPTEGQIFNQNDINFNWTAVDYNSSVPVSCNLTIDGVLNKTGINDFSGNFINYTVQNITDGPHNWSVSCTDDLNNLGTSGTGNFTINQPDLSLDSGHINFNNTNPDVGETLLIRANVSNIGGITANNANVSFWDGDPATIGIYIGSKVSNVTNNESVLFSVPWTITSGYHTIYVSADPQDLIGELNESNNNATKTISVLQSIINSPANNTYYAQENSTFNVTLNDYTGGLINYSVFVDDSATGQIGQLTDGTPGIFNITFAEGTHLVKIEALDALGRKKNSTQLTIVTDLQPPVIVVSTPNATWFNYSTPEINFTLTDAIDPVLNYSIYVNGTIDSSGNATNGTINLINLSTLQNGSYSVIVEAWDEVNHITNSTPIIIYVDTVKPYSTLNSPADGANLTSTNVALNFTVSDNMASYINTTIHLDGGTANYLVNSGAPFIYNTTGISEGIHYWNISYFDEAHNSNISETRSFNVFIPPVITLLSPANASWTNNPTTIFTYNVSDDSGITNCSLIINGVINQTNTSVLNNAVNSFTVNNLNGTYPWAVECYDSSAFNAYASTETRTRYVDLDSPVPVISTINDTWFNVFNPGIDFNITDNMDSVLNYTLFSNDALNTAGTIANATPTTKNLLGLVNGTYKIDLQATDEATNTQNATPITIHIDTVKPSVALNYPPNATNFTSTAIDLNFTPTDNLAPTLNCSLTIDGSSQSSINVANNTQQNITLSGLGGGYHYWNVSCTDLAGNNNISETRQFYIMRPDISVNSSEIYFSNPEPIENETINITATIRNIGNLDTGNFVVKFLNGATQIGSDFTINLTAGEARNLSVNFTSLIGTNQINVEADTPLATNGTISEENESNNLASRNITVGLWQFTSGSTTDRLVVTNSANGLLYDWNVDNASGSNIYVTDSDSNPNWDKLQALGRNVSNQTSSEDFAVLDSKINATDMVDSVNRTYTSGGAPVETQSYKVFSKQINNVPVYNSTNNSNFKTGILWDFGDGGNAFNGSQDVVFISTIEKGLQGYNGTADYELRIPATLRDYKGPDYQSVDFYVEIK